MRVLAALVLCVAVVVPAQAADAAPHKHKAKQKHARRCHKAPKRRGRAHGSRRARRCAAKRKAVAKHLAPKTLSPSQSLQPLGPAAGPPVAGGGPTTSLGRYLSVGGKEFSLQLSRPALAAGAVTLEFRNIGEDPHDLVLSPDDGSHARLASFGETASGGLVTQSLTLPAGRYYLFCSLPNHESLGMSAHLRVQ
jgi:plastocyanin